MAAILSALLCATSLQGRVEARQTTGALLATMRANGVHRACAAQAKACTAAKAGQKEESKAELLACQAQVQSLSDFHHGCRAFWF